MVELAYSESSLACFIISVTQLKAASLEVLTLTEHNTTSDYKRHLSLDLKPGLQACHLYS